MWGNGRAPAKPEDTGKESNLRWFLRRVRRHVGWWREQGLGPLLEEADANPLVNIPARVEKWRWRRAHDVAPNAIPIYVVGVQRSGTNMFVRGLKRSPEFEVYNENHRRAFHRFRLKRDEEIRNLIIHSNHRYVLFKPLCDSHRVIELLDGIDTPSRGKALWLYRSVDDCALSTVAKFGANSLNVLSEISEGRGMDRWQAQGLSDKDLAIVRSFDYNRLSPLSGAALFWYLRNSLYFNLLLHQRDDVILASYERLLAQPEETMATVCSFLDFTYHPRLIEHIRPGPSAPSKAIDLHPKIRQRCDDLHERLDVALRAKIEGR